MENRINYTSTKIAAYVGYLVQAIINNFLPILFIALQNVYGIGYEKLGRLILFNFFTQLIIDIITPKIVDRIGYRKTAFLCQGLAAAGLIILGILPRLMPDPYVAIVISVIVYASASGMMEVIISPMVESLPTDNKSGNMSILHSFYCWGQALTVIITTLLIGAFGYKNWSYIPVIWAIVPFINMWSFLKVPIVEPSPEQKNDSLKKLIKSPVYIGFLIMMFSAGASEIAMAEWVSMFVQQALGVSKVIGDLAGPCAFAIFMGIGRVLYAVFSNRISFKKSVTVLSALCIVCYFVAAFCKIPVFSLVACATCGFTVSIFWPGTLSAGAAVFPKGGAVLYSTFAMFGDLGCCFGPWLLGIIADNRGLHTGFAVSSVFPVIMLISSIFFLKEKD